MSSPSGRGNCPYCNIPLEYKKKVKKNRFLWECSECGTMVEARVANEDDLEMQDDGA